MKKKGWSYRQSDLEAHRHRRTFVSRNFTALQATKAIATVSLLV